MAGLQTTSRRSLLAVLSTVALLPGCQTFQRDDYILHVINHHDEPLDSVEVTVIDGSETAYEREFALGPDESREIPDAFPPGEYSLQVQGASIEMYVDELISPNGCETPEVYVAIERPDDVAIKQKDC